jgi:hypothetical protein
MEFRVLAINTNRGYLLCTGWARAARRGTGEGQGVKVRDGAGLLWEQMCTYYTAK